MSTGDRLSKLEWLRDTYQAAIEEGLPPRDLAAVGARLEKVLAEIDGLTNDDSDLADELASKRAERVARTGTEGG